MARRRLRWVRPSADERRRSYVEVADGTVSYAIGCNGTGMYARLGEDGRLRSREPIGDEPAFIQTLLGCGRGGNEREEAYFGFLGQGAPSVGLASDGTLLLRNADHVLRLRRARPGKR